MKITHSTKITASEERPWYVVDYKIPDDPESVRREERRRMQRELADEEDAYDLEHGEGIYSSESAAPVIKPAGGDMINYVMVYTGPGYEKNTPQAVLEWGRKNGFDKMYWGSDTAYGMQGMYNGDTYILYKDANKLPAGYREDALDAESHDRIMSCQMIEGATAEELQKRFAEYQKMNEQLGKQLDDLQQDQLNKFNKATQKKEKKGFFKRAFGSEDAPVCYKVGENADSIDYVVSSENIDSTKWMGKYLTPDGQVKHIYFDCETEDWNEAEQQFEEVIAEPYTSCKLLGKAPANISADHSFMYVESATRQITGQLLGELQAQLHEAIHRYLVDEQGFDEVDVPGDITNISADSIFFVDVYKTEEGSVCAEVRAELSYNSMEELADLLNDKVIQKYDPDAYFEQVDPGIMDAYLFNDNIRGASSIQGASPVADTRDHWLEAEDIPDIDYIDDYQEEITLDFDVDIDIAPDGSYNYIGEDPEVESLEFAMNPDSDDGNYYLTLDDLDQRVQLRDYISVVENLDTLLVDLIPESEGVHHISGQANLVYNVSGIARDSKGTFANSLVVEFDRDASEINNFQFK